MWTLHWVGPRCTVHIVAKSLPGFKLDSTLLSLLRKRFLNFQIHNMNINCDNVLDNR